MQRSDRGGPNGAWSTNTSNREQYNDNIDVEAVALGNSVVNNPIRSNARNNGPIWCAVRFGADTEYTLSLQSDLTWKELKEKAIGHDAVQGAFQNPRNVGVKDFALVVSSTIDGREETLITHDSELNTQTLDETLLEHGSFLARQSQRGGNTVIPVLLLYAPMLHICTFDGLRVSLPTLGHWLHVQDTKAKSKLVPSKASKSTPAGREATPTNSLLLTEANTPLFCQFLSRLNKFLRCELKLQANEYAISIPFGERSEFKNEIHASVQLANPKIIWSLYLHFEQELNKRLDEPLQSTDLKVAYILHQREIWTTLRFADYRAAAERDAIQVKQAYDALVSGQPSKSEPQLPPSFLFDGNRMQIHYEMGESLDTMHGHLGSISKELRTLVDKYVELVHTLRFTSFHLIIHGAQSHFSLDPGKYMKILRASGENAREWAANILDAVKSPERLYSGLLAEGAGLAPCSANGLLQASYGGETEGPAMEKRVLNSLLERNKTDRRLFLAQSNDSTPLSNSSRSSQPIVGRSRLSRQNPEQPPAIPLRQDPVATKSRNGEARPRDATMNQPTRSGFAGSRANEDKWRDTSQTEAGTWRRKTHSQSMATGVNGQWRRGERERAPTRQFQVAANTGQSNSNWRDKRQTANDLAKKAESTRQVQAVKPLNGYSESYYDSYDDQYSRDYTQDYLADADMHYGGVRGMENLSLRDDGYDSYHEEPSRGYDPKMKRSNKDTSFPGPGYVCRICGQPGGGPDSHWFQQCPNADETNGGGYLGTTKRPPGLGYVCKICGQKGGVPGAHWVQQCTESGGYKDRGDAKTKPGGGFGEFWKDRSPAASSWTF